MDPSRHEQTSIGGERYKEGNSSSFGLSCFSCPSFFSSLPFLSQAHPRALAQYLIPLELHFFLFLFFLFPFSFSSFLLLTFTFHSLSALIILTPQPSQRHTRTSSSSCKTFLSQLKILSHRLSSFFVSAPLLILPLLDSALLHPPWRPSANTLFYTSFTLSHHSTGNMSLEAEFRRGEYTRLNLCTMLCCFHTTTFFLPSSRSHLDPWMDSGCSLVARWSTRILLKPLCKKSLQE